MITDPSILFCDEPTSGLDSFMAVSIADLMQDLAKNGKTIICTIHQPSSEIFEKFDKLCLMVEGRVAFFGETYKAKDFFLNVGLPVPPDYNPADFYIKNLAIQPNNIEKSKKVIERICNSYDNSEEKRKKLETIKILDNINTNDTKTNGKIKKESKYYELNIKADICSVKS